MPSREVCPESLRSRPLACGSKDSADRLHEKSDCRADIFQTILSSRRRISHLFGCLWRCPVTCPERHQLEIQGDIVSTVAATSRIAELRRALSQADSSAFLVEARVIRRVIRERFGFAKLSSSIPHTESQLVSARDIRHLVHPDELGLSDFSGLPETCILLCEPDEDEMDHWPTQELLQKVWRQLFHARVDLTLTVFFTRSCLDRMSRNESPRSARLSSMRLTLFFEASCDLSRRNLASKLGENSSQSISNCDSSNQICFPPGFHQSESAPSWTASLNVMSMHKSCSSELDCTARLSQI